jgi:[protein-PII] uridylyltransferase
VAHAAVVRSHLVTDELASVALVQQEAHDEIQLCVVAADRPGLLAQIAATLAAARLQVHAAQIYSCALGQGGGEPQLLAVDVFWVQAAGGRTPAAGSLPALMQKLGRDLAAVVAGQTSASELLPGRRSSRRREREGPEVQSRVIVDDRAAPDHTVVEVFTRDRAGLLFALAHAIYKQGMSIAVAKIATEGARVVDVFYVSEPDGRKISSSERADALKQALLELIEGMDD